MTKYEKAMLVIAIIALVVDLLTFLFKQVRWHKKSPPRSFQLWAGFSLKANGDGRLTANVPSFLAYYILCGKSRVRPKKQGLCSLNAALDSIYVFAYNNAYETHSPLGRDYQFLYAGLPLRGLFCFSRFPAEVMRLAVGAGCVY